MSWTYIESFYKRSSNLLNGVMGTVGEIIVLVKYSPKRETMLGTIKDNFETEDEDVFDNTTTQPNYV